MQDLFYFVDPSIPGLSGRDLLRLGQRDSKRATSREAQQRIDLGLDRRNS